MDTVRECNGCYKSRYSALPIRSQYALLLYDQHAVNMLCVRLEFVAHIVSMRCDRPPSAIKMLSTHDRPIISITNYAVLMRPQYASMCYRETIECY